MADEPQLEKLTDEEIEAWVPLKEALRLVLLDMPPDAAREALAKRIWRGLIRAGAQNYYDTRQRDGAKGAIEIEKEHWGDVDLREDSPSWTTGIMTFYVPIPIVEGFQRSANSAVEYFGVRLDPSGLRKMLGPKGIAAMSQGVVAETAALSASISSAKDKGGRPARDDWDDILAATAGEMLGGRLIPKRASDVEKFMLQWASDKGRPLGTTAVKSPAKKLFEVFKKEVGN